MVSGIRTAYIACPHSHPHDDVKQARFEAVTHISGLFMSLGMRVFSPISHTHPIHTRLAADGRDLEHDEWLAQDKPFLMMCDVLVVCMMPGWEESKGVQKEIRLFEKLNKPIVYIMMQEWERLTWWT